MELPINVLIILLVSLVVTVVVIGVVKDVLVDSERSFDVIKDAGINNKILKVPDMTGRGVAELISNCNQAYISSVDNETCYAVKIESGSIPVLSDIKSELASFGYDSIFLKSSGYSSGKNIFIFSIPGGVVEIKSK